MRVDDLKKKAKKDRQKELDKKKSLLMTIFFIFIIAIAILIVWIIIFKNTSRTNTYENTYLKVKYDSSWTLSRNVTDSISLIHKTNSYVDIKINKLQGNSLNSDISSIADEVKYDIKKQNSNYKLLKEDTKVISKNRYDAYRILYENGDSQSLVIALRKDDYLFLVNYTAKDEYFDILLDSFEAILTNLELK